MNAINTTQSNLKKKRATMRSKVTWKNLFSFLFIWFDRFMSFLGLYKNYRDKIGFKKLFYKSECQVLLGRSSRYFWWVFILFFITILAIGFAKDSLRFLNKQMSDPFVRSVTADLVGELEDLEQNVSYQEYKENPDSAAAYLYSSIYEFSKFRNHFERSSAIPGRTVLPNDTLVGTILEYEDNNAIGHRFDVANEFSIKPEKNYSLIVTYHLLKEVLGHDIEKDPPFIHLYQEDIPIPISAVVEQLPDKREFISTPYFYDNIRTHEIECFRTRDSLNKVYVIFDIDPANREKINQKVIEAFTELKNAGNSPLDQLSFNAGEDRNKNFVYAYSLTFRPTSFVQIDFQRNLSPQEQQDAFDRFVGTMGITTLLKEYNKEASSVIKFYWPSLSYESSDAPSRQAICVSFTNLNRVKDFANNFFGTTQIELEMGMIKSLENYNFVTILTLAVSLVLIIFSFLSISFFVRNMIANHLNKIKMNIGTYKAFGIEIKTIYKNMVFVFILTSELLALAACIIIAKMGLLLRLVKLYNEDISNEFDFFYIYDLEAVIILVAMLVISYLSSAWVINRLFRNTPGDLVYNRTE
ncbi:MAG: hypothetical protein NT175_02105 [Bacteroidetes bacterium]|nr:hypothetical protein [Bacteroidota bacterium]